MNYLSDVDNGQPLIGSLNRHKMSGLGQSIHNDPNTIKFSQNL